MVGAHLAPAEEGLGYGRERTARLMDTCAAIQTASERDRAYYETRPEANVHVQRLL